MLVGNPCISLPLSLAKMLSMGAVSMKSMERNLFSAITTPFSHHLPENQIFSYCPHLCLHMGNPLTPSLFLLTKMLSLGVVAMISTDRSHIRLLSPHLPAIFVKIPFFDHFHCFLPFLPAYEQTLCPISACVDKNNFTGRCCNDICKERATLGYYHPILPPFA